MQKDLIKNDFILEYLTSLNNIFSRETKELTALGLVIFIAPFFLTNQLILGTIVNALLIKSAIDYKTNKVFLISFLPSLAVIINGFLFLGLTSQMIYILPFIWLGNISIMYLTRALFKMRKLNYFTSALISSAVKTLILFSAAFILFNLNLVPVLFLTTFGIIQFFTAMSGAILIFLTKIKLE